MEGASDRANLEIDQLDTLEEDRDLSIEEKGARKIAMGKLWDLKYTAEIYWKQRSRVRWLKKGER